MVEVARRCGLSLATLYRRFASKNDLIEAVALRQTRDFITGVDEVLARQVDRDAGAEDQIVELFVAFLKGLRENQLVHRLLATEPELVLPSAVSMALTPQTVIPLGDDEQARRFARDHVVVSFRVPQAEVKAP
ncbi:TetR family transcriptional regulator [Mycobacteroides abscessus subsp. abscessus]|nr:TetR family transcriptional regulator [Mycobacteroides abscessus subsp. abscessus]